MTRRRVGRPVTQADLDRIAALVERGLSTSQIARAMERSYATIQYHLVDLGMIEIPAKRYRQRDNSARKVLFSTEEDAYLLDHAEEMRGALAARWPSLFGRPRCAGTLSKRIRYLTAIELALEERAESPAIPRAA
jgi:hypothetical protein